MDAGLTNCIALGVPDKVAAAKMYAEAFGFEVVKETEEWTELRAGALRLFLCEDQVREPAFSVTVEDVEATTARLKRLGFTDAGYDSDEVFLRDPFGYVFNIYPVR